MGFNKAQGDLSLLLFRDEGQGSLKEQEQAFLPFLPPSPSIQDFTQSFGF